MKGCRIIWCRCAPSHTKPLKKNSSLPLLLTPPPKIWRRKNACVHTLKKLKKSYWAGGGTTVKRYRKTNGAKQLLAAFRVGGVVTTQEPIVSSEVELMGKRILADYERDVFSGEVRRCRARNILRSVVRSGLGLLSLTYTRALNPSP